MLHRPTLVKLWCVFTGCVARHLVRCTQATNCTTMHGRFLCCCNRSTARQHVAFWFCNSHDVLRCSMLTVLRTQVTNYITMHGSSSGGTIATVCNMRRTTCGRQPVPAAARSGQCDLRCCGVCETMPCGIPCRYLPWRESDTMHAMLRLVFGPEILFSSPFLSIREHP